MKASLLGTVKRRDGRLQVTYADQPLYFYVNEGPGEVRCHNVNLNGGLWWVVGPDGKQARMRRLALALATCGPRQRRRGRAGDGRRHEDHGPRLRVRPDAVGTRTAGRLRVSARPPEALALLREVR